MIRRVLSLVIYTQTTLIGLVAFLYPFWLPAVHQSAAAGAGAAHADDAPLMLTLLVGLCFAVLLLEVQGQLISAKTIALLGILAAINAALRFVSVALPGPGGFSPIFFLIALTGYVFGARFGFLMGALTLLVSALITGGVGPWLPYQMFTAGWMGLSMPLCRPLVWLLPDHARWGKNGWGEITILAGFAGLWGVGYGMIMNIWFWPFASGAADQSWTPGMSLATTVQHYAVFYVATSRFWDMLRLIGNVVLIFAFGLPTLRVLRRFQQRFEFVYQPIPTALSPELLADKRVSCTHSCGRERFVTQTYTIHPLAWLAWLAAVLIALTTTRNPFYIGLILLWIATVAWQARTTEAFAVRPLSLPFSLMRFGLFIVIVSALFNALTVHIGNTVVGRLPRAIPLLGGTITLEAAVYGALNGLVLIGILAAFLLVNQVVPVRALIQLIPRAYYPVAVVVAIALSFVPVTLRQFQQVREAQAVRGHRVRGLRDWLPLLMPLLIGGLERALQLAEAMMARGFAGGEGAVGGNASVEAQKYKQLQIAQIGGLLVLISGWLLRLVWQQNLLGLVLMLLGGAGVISTLWLVGRRHPHTVHRPTSWCWQDWLIGVGAAVVIALFLLPLPRLMRASLFYYPYPMLTRPLFTPLLGLATIGLLAPAIFILDFRFWIDERTLARRIKSKIQNSKSKIEPL